MKKLIFLLVLIVSIGGYSQDVNPDRSFTAGFNLHKFGIRSPTYAGLENIRLGYWFHRYHQAGLEAGMLRSVGGGSNPVAGAYYRFTGLDGKFHVFFEGQGKIWFQRNLVSGNIRDFVYAAYAGINFELSEKFSVDAAIGRSSFDWDQKLGFNFKF